MLGVAALSTRALAEAARDDGFEVIALDLFGDADTRRACSQWASIGAPGSMHIDADRLLTSLRGLAQRGDVVGWIAGSGLEGRPELLAQGAALLPLLGTQADAVKRVRDSHAFFAFLDAEQIAHPAVRATALDDTAGWLIKDAHGCGGWHIRRAPVRSGEAMPPHHYFQREMPGTPMSATFIADGREACVLGFNEQIVRSFGERPFVYCGVVGPVALAPDVAGRITAVVRALTREFDLRGLCGLDFLLDDETFGVLEVNPRPPASMALYGRGTMAAHVRACLHGDLPRAPWLIVERTVAGTEIVYASRPLSLDSAAMQRLAQRPECHDLPADATRFEAGDPVCSVSARGAGAAQVRALLERARKAVEQSLETAS